MIEGKVVDVIGLMYGTANANTRAVINRGSDHGVAVGQEFLIYTVGNEVVDPDTGESLGQIEIVHGRGRVQHVQPKMASLVSSETRMETRKAQCRRPRPLDRSPRSVASREAKTSPSGA